MEKTLDQVAAELDAIRATVAAELDALRATARRYDSGVNEGGDGYNPHADALRRLEAKYDQAAIAAAEAGCAVIRAAEHAEWTRELTVQRRQEWNAWVRAQGAKIAPAQVAAQIVRQGWSVESLRLAIARHGL